MAFHAELSQTTIDWRLLAFPRFDDRMSQLQILVQTEAPGANAPGGPNYADKSFLIKHISLQGTGHSLGAERYIQPSCHDIVVRAALPRRNIQVDAGSLCPEAF